MNTTIIFILSVLDLFEEVIHLVFQVGLLARKYLVPVVVYGYCLIVQYIVPAMSIPRYYIQVRQQRLALG
jgi:hypothetical protein